MSSHQKRPAFSVRPRSSPNKEANDSREGRAGMIHRAKRTLLRANSLFLRAIRRFNRNWLQILPPQPN
jgi:hypothetical protein